MQVLAPQAVARMGGEEEAARILSSVETVVCHRVNTPEDLVGPAGTRQMMEYSTRFARGGSTGEGTAMRREHQKIDANDVLSLPPGEAFVISRGTAMRAQILRAPEVRAPLPGMKSAFPETSARDGADPSPGERADCRDRGTRDERAGKGQSKDGDARMQLRREFPVGAVCLYVLTAALEVPVIVARYAAIYVMAAIAMKATDSSSTDASEWAKLAVVPAMWSAAALVNPAGG